jgi:hypothetical protein
MNPKHLSVRMDRETGALWLTEERYRKPIKRVADLTAPIFLAMCADLVAEEGTKSVTRDMKFSDGFVARLTVEVVEDTDDPEDVAGAMPVV